MTTKQGEAPQMLSVQSYQFRYESKPLHTSDGLHQHNGYEVYIHVRGEQVFHLGDAVFPLHPLDTFVIAPGQVHGIPDTHPITNYEYMSLILTPELLDELSFRNCRLLQELERIIGNPHQQLHLTQELWRILTSLVSGIKDDAPGLHPTEQQITLGCMSTLLGILCFASNLGSTPYMTPNTTRQTIRHIGMHISRNFTEDCSLDHLADRFSMSKYHLAHSFASVYGMSLHQYVTHCRITYARRLLHQGEAPSNVAQACGFNDYSSFLRAFRRCTGLSPSQWKKENAALPALP